LDRNEKFTENQDHNENEDEKVSYISLGICFGVSLGITVGGLLFDNMAMGISIGVGLGLAVGALLDSKRK